MTRRRPQRRDGHGPVDGTRGGSPPPRGLGRRVPLGTPDDGRSASGRRGGAPGGLGGEQVEGRHAVRELLAAGRRQVREVWIAADLDPSPQIDDIERLAARRRTRVLTVPRRRLEAAARTDAPQGVLARAEALHDVDVARLAHPRSGLTPFVVVVDGVTDPHNLGALLRVAECAGVTGMVLPRHRAVHVTPTVTKVAAGAIEHLPLALVPGVPSALKDLTGLGVASVGLDAGAPLSLFDIGSEAIGPVALVVGSEGRGLATLTRKRCTVLAAIPQFGAVGSLNVATAGAVACFELARRRAAAGTLQ